MRILGTLCLLLALSGCSSLLFYPEPGQLFTPEKAKLEYREVTLITADGLKLNAWWLPAKKGGEVKGTILHLHGNHQAFSLRPSAVIRVISRYSRLAFSGVNNWPGSG